MKTVFFGPFIGEFGWEYLYWHAWVNNLCISDYKSFNKIVSSFPGRESFYPYADEYWPHPDELLSELKSCNGYITDYWINGFPRPNTSINQKFMGLIPYEKWKFQEQDTSQIPVIKTVGKLLEKYKSKLPQDTTFFTPFKKCTFNDFNFGVIHSLSPKNDNEIKQIPIPFSKQNFELLKATKKAEQLIKNYLNDEEKLIAIYPRNRLLRRTDKNWSKEKYLKLIEYFKLNFPEYRIGIFGSPQQAYFDGGVPNGTIDFINLPNTERMNIQIAALKQAKLAVGSLSGAVLVSRAAGVPTLSWGLQRDAKRFYNENRNNIETIFHPIQNPKPEDIMKLSTSILKKTNNYERGFDKWSSINHLNYGNGNLESKFQMVLNFFRSIFYAKNKNFE